jgi:hypothetical protein
MVRPFVRVAGPPSGFVIVTFLPPVAAVVATVMVAV